MRFVVITGMSGAGKMTARKLLEDIGFYCVDNLPVPLLEKFVDLLYDPNSDIEKVALVLDVRSSIDFAAAKKSLDRIKNGGHNYDIIFMDASDETLIKRYKETRRRHPLQSKNNSRLKEGIAREREILAEIKSQANYVFDTSNLLVRSLQEEFAKIFEQGQAYDNLMVSITSFGFKNGIPIDADLVFDVRFLPNPYYEDDLKHQTGNDKAVQDYVMASGEADEFLDKLEDMSRFLIPAYIREGKHQLVVAIGCTGGHHRSVTIANKLYERLKDNSNFGLNLSHRDITK